MATRRPDYVPPTWTRGRMNRWFMERPSRVVAFFAFMSVVIFGVLAWAVLDPHDFFSHPRSYAALLAAAVFLVQAAIYVPRAIRAMRR